MNREWKPETWQAIDRRDLLAMFAAIGLRIKELRPFTFTSDWEVYLEKDNPPEAGLQVGHSLNEIRRWMISDPSEPAFYVGLRLYSSAWPGDLAGDHITYAGCVLMHRALAGDPKATEILREGPHAVEIFAEGLRKENSEWIKRPA